MLFVHGKKSKVLPEVSAPICRSKSDSRMHIKQPHSQDAKRPIRLEKGRGLVSKNGKCVRRLKTHDKRKNGTVEVV